MLTSSDRLCQPEASQAPHWNSEPKAQQGDEPLICPQLPTLYSLTSLRHGFEHESSFNLYDVISAIQSGDPMDLVYQYLAFRHKKNRQELENEINGEIEGFPAIFYVVETHNAELIRRWAKYGGNVNATHVATGIPLIAFVILREYRPRIKSVEMLKLLLTLGASPLVIPAAFYSPFNRELPSSGPIQEERNDGQDDNKIWCKPSLRRLLSASLGLTHRYLLNRAAGIQPASGRKRVLTCRNNSEALLGVDLLVIGQEMAIWSLKRSLLEYVNTHHRIHSI